MGRYVLIHDGEMFVALDSKDFKGSFRDTSTVTARWASHRVPMRPVYRSANRHFGYWFTCPATTEPDAIEVQAPERKNTVSYRLTDERLKGTMPETLTPDEARPLWHEDSATYDPVAMKVYEAVTESYLPEPNIITGWLRLDGKPWPESDLKWIADLPYDLMYQAAYAHLFPGHIEGNFKKELCEILKGRPDVSYCFDEPGYLKVTVIVGVSTRELRLRPPYRVEGPDFATALKNRDAEIAKAFAAVEEISSAVCPTCNGSGTTIPRPEQPKRRRGRSRA